MLYLRLVRGYRIADLGRWLLTAGAAAAVAALLLRALGRALGEPSGASVVRLLWCLPPLAAVGWFAAVAARALPTARPERITGLTAAGAGPSSIRTLIAGEIALACALGSGLTLLAFLVLRNDIAGASLAPAVGLGLPLPAAAPVTLLFLVPLAAGASAAAAVRVADALPGQPELPHRTGFGFGALRLALPTGLVLIGLALELYGLRPGAAQDGRPVDLPAGLGTTSTAALLGWAFAALGLALLTAPLLAWGGRLLALGRPTPLRLLAARGLTAEAPRLGAPLAVLALSLSAGLAAVRYWARRPGTVEAVPAVEAALIVGCAVAAVLIRAAQIRNSRRSVTAALLQLGAAPRLLLGAAVLRTAAAGTVLLVTGGLTAALAAGALR
ncbi:hypothetical protein [Saccharothrix sp. ST-888]|uniref:hypothetical protein n=1 Tax=Saccharothrix sp. ST-888 TaxID=1427391 RepID=UPI0005EC1A82|nr:hypothetical protein [Saccharothrix sp. ST-888]KJK58804.1 hypothetical protein UK12_08250 [Saccharothrix sp. ST-888]